MIGLGSPRDQMIVIEIFVVMPSGIHFPLRLIGTSLSGFPRLAQVSTGNWGGSGQWCWTQAISHFEFFHVNATI